MSNLPTASSLLPYVFPCSQGGSPNQPVPWVHPADLSPAALAAREAHEHMHVPGGDRSPLALAAAAGHAEAVAALRRRGAHLDMASLRHAGKEGGEGRGGVGLPLACSAFWFMPALPCRLGRALPIGDLAT